MQEMVVSNCLRSQRTSRKNRSSIVSVTLLEIYLFVSVRKKIVCIVTLSYWTWIQASGIVPDTTSTSTYLEATHMPYPKAVPIAVAHTDISLIWCQPYLDDGLFSFCKKDRFIYFACFTPLQELCNLHVYLAQMMPNLCASFFDGTMPDMYTPFTRI